MKEILGELLGSTDQAVMDQFISEYTVANDGTTLTMYGTGDFGDAGNFYFQQPESSEVKGDVLTVTGHVSTGASYSAVYRANPLDTQIGYRFESVTVSGTGN